MKVFRCGDVVPGCARAFTGSEEQILTAVAEHARADHGIEQVTNELVLTVRSLMRDEA